MIHWIVLSVCCIDEGSSVVGKSGCCWSSLETMQEEMGQEYLEAPTCCRLGKVMDRLIYAWIVWQTTSRWVGILAHFSVGNIRQRVVFHPLHYCKRRLCSFTGDEGTTDIETH